jgi:hypothetical protein
MTRALLIAGLLLGAPGLAGAQDAPEAARMVQVDPIRCWWRTSAGAVRVGETFTVGLTCAVLEADGVQVVPDESQLNDSAIQLNPFEVVGGTHPPDLRSGQRRFFQYDYLVRVINPDVIGKDVPLPNLVVHYRVNSRLPGNAALQGRDLSYLLPPHQVRVLSLVPAEASDIRDVSGESFERVEALEVRAGVLEIGAITLVALGSLMVIVSLVGLLRGSRKAVKTEEKAVSGWRSLTMAERELAAVARDSERQGWNEALVGRALAAMRIAAASALGRPVSQAYVEPDAETGGGRLVSPAPRLSLPGRKARTVALSSAVTPQEVMRTIDRLSERTPAARRQLLERLGEAMAALTKVQYGQPAALDRTALDQAVADAAAATRRLKSRWILSWWSRRRAVVGAPLERGA